LRGLYYFDLV